MIFKGGFMAKGFRVIVNDEEYDFLKKLAKNDNISVRTEVQRLLSLQIWEEMEVQKEFMDKG